MGRRAKRRRSGQKLGAANAVWHLNYALLLTARRLAEA